MDNKIELIQQTNDNKRKATASFILGIWFNSVRVFALIYVMSPVVKSQEVIGKNF